MDYKVKRSNSEIERVRNFANEGEMNGSKFPGMNYEAGVNATLRWLFGEAEDAPDES
jgi:hypothetical protein